MAAVATEKDAPGLAGDLARMALKICHAEVESVKSRQAVRLD